jgi:hydroxylamine dehydrogenase
VKRMILLTTLLCWLASPSWAADRVVPNELSETTQECLECHQTDNPGMYQQWGVSKHYGANVGCYECHQAQASDADVLHDDIHDDFTIATIVSPLDCSRCHPSEVEEFENSHHSKAGRIMGSLDNLLAEVVEGNNGMVTPAFPAGVSAAAVNGCWQCHGSTVKVDPETGTLDPATWPNTGIGRVNPDGSEGSCTACHQRHSFSAEQARHPDNCGKCHLGPDHPQKEIYEESKHGIAFRANVDKMNLSSSKWIVGEDYTAAPTCATCHMSATSTQPISHNIGLRIKWNNRPAISKLAHETDAKWNLSSASITGDERREKMEDVCQACHQSGFVKGFFVQYEGLIDLYNDKYAKPGLELYAAATAVLKTESTYAKFSHPIDFTWFEIWHHEGRRARHAASMQAPDYTHWHGTYDLAKNWMSKFVPELKEIIREYRDTAPEEVAALEAKLEEVQHSDNWKWSINAEDDAVKKARQKRQDEFKARYDN